MNISKLFIQSLPKRSCQIKEFAEQTLTDQSNSPWKQLRRIFHSLKTSASMAGYFDLAQIAAEAEHLANNHTGLSLIKAISNFLEKCSKSPGIINNSHPEIVEILDLLNQESSEPSPQNGQDL